MANSNFTCTLDAWVVGTTIHAQMHYSRSGSYFYSDSTFPTPTMTIDGTNYSDTAFRDRVRSGVTVGSVYSTEYTKTVSANGTYTVKWVAGAGQRNDFEGTWTTTVTVSSASTPPATPTVSASTVSPTQIDITYGTTSFGSPSTGSVVLYGDKNNPPSDVLNIKTTTGNSTFSFKNLIPNTTYYFRSRAANSQSYSNYSSVVSATTFPTPSIITFDSTTKNSITINYSVPASGGQYDEAIQYSIDGGTTWVTITTITGGTATSGSYTISGLQEGNSYTIMVRTNSTAGSTYATPLRIIAGLSDIKKFYGSVSDQTTPICNLYGSVSSQATRIKKLYGSVNGEAKLFYRRYGSA